MSIGRMIIAFIFLAVFYGGLNYYIGRRIFQGLTAIFPHMNGLIFAGIYIFFAISLILGQIPLPIHSGIKGVLSFIGSVWIGFFVYLLIFFLVADLLILLGSKMNIFPSPMPQNIRFIAGLIVVFVSTGFVFYGIYNANQTKLVSYDIQLKEETILSDDMKIVLISDTHFGAVNSENRLASMVERINNQKPDLVCIAGDIFNDNFNAIRNSDKVSDLLKSITATYGVYASLGNHDGGNTFNEMINFLEQSNIKLLNDEYVIIDERLVLLGRVDPSPIGGFGELKRKSSEEIKEIIASLDPNMPVVVMDHNPSTIKEYGGEVDLILSGHTHNGQIFPANLVTNAMYIVDYGHYQKDDESPHVIVTSGVSTWGMPMRIGSNNEIVTILLRP